MIIFKKQYNDASGKANENIGDELKLLLETAGKLVKRAEQGVVSERSPITLIEKVQISDTVKLVKKLIIDIDKDIGKGRNTDKNEEKLKDAVVALQTSIDNIL